MATYISKRRSVLYHILDILILTLEYPFPGTDLVVHAAGPFQREDKCTVLEAAISTKVSVLERSTALISCIIFLVSVEVNDMLINELCSSSIYRHHTLMFVMMLIIRGEQKVSMNRRKLVVFQLLLLQAYVLE